GNVIRNNADGFYIEADNAANTNHTTANVDGVYANSNSGATSAGPGTIDADLRAVWWGNTSGPAHAQNPGGTANGVVGSGIAFSPWLGFDSPGGTTPPFTLASPMTWYVSTGVCKVTCIQAAVDFSSNGDTVLAKTGTYPEHVTINKDITVSHTSLPVIDGGGSGDVVTITADGATLDGFEITNGTNGVVVASGADNVTVINNLIHNFTSAGLRGTNGTGETYSTNTITGPHTGSCIGGFWGMLLQDESGTISGNAISGIGNGITTGCQEGRAIEAKGAGTLQITNNNISQYQKSGIIVRDTLNTTISGNTTAGEGLSNIIAQNGITVTSTGTASITNNITSGHRYTGPADPVSSCGILTFNTAVISGNSSTNDEVG